MPLHGSRLSAKIRSSGAVATSASRRSISTTCTTSKPSSRRSGVRRSARDWGGPSRRWRRRRMPERSPPGALRPGTVCGFRPSIRSTSRSPRSGRSPGRSRERATDSGGSSFRSISPWRTPSLSVRSKARPPRRSACRPSRPRASLASAAFGSASLLQGRLAAELPDEVVLAFPEADTPARRALQFSRSAPGLTSALVGVSDVAHASENFGLAAVPPAEPNRILGIFGADGN